MANELAVMNAGAVGRQQQPVPPMPKIMEEVLLAGDLAKLTPDQRVSFYGSLCQSLGLNPLTKPFDYLNLSGKLTLYAGKACAEQLRFQHGLSVKIMARETIDGVYVVTAKATMPNGREDESTGAVPIGSLQGEARANAFMKAETKAKRRVTLSICGLGMLDESEVDSIRGASRVPVNMDTGDIDTGGHPVGTQAAANHVADRKIAEMKKTPPADKSRDFAMLEAFSKIKKQIGDKSYYIILGNNGYGHSNEITDVSKARSIYAEMAGYLKSMRQPDPEPVKVDPVRLTADDGADVPSSDEWEAGRD